MQQTVVRKAEGYIIPAGWYYGLVGDYQAPRCAICENVATFSCGCCQVRKCEMPECENGTDGTTFRSVKVSELTNATLTRHKECGYEFQEITSGSNPFVGERRIRVPACDACGGRKFIVLETCVSTRRVIEKTAVYNDVLVSPPVPITASHLLKPIMDSIKCRTGYSSTLRNAVINDHCELLFALLTHDPTSCISEIAKLQNDRARGDLIFSEPMGRFIEDLYAFIHPSDYHPKNKTRHFTEKIYRYIYHFVRNSPHDDPDWILVGLITELRELIDNDSISELLRIVTDRRQNFTGIINNWSKWHRKDGVHLLKAWRGFHHAYYTINPSTLTSQQHLPPSGQDDIRRNLDLLQDLGIVCVDNYIDVVTSAERIIRRDCIQSFLSEMRKRALLNREKYYDTIKYYMVMAAYRRGDTDLVCLPVEIMMIIGGMIIERRSPIESR